jgi:uncharacterized membrane-anchored protein
MRMSMLPPDHPQRHALADEVHARPSEALQTPSRASYLAILIDPPQRDREAAHLAELCTAFGVAAPAAGSTHFATPLGDLRLRWERHGEFSGYLILQPGLSATAFGEPPTSRLPAGWIAAIPGQTMLAAQAEIARADDGFADAAALAATHFAGHTIIGSELGDGAGLAFTDWHLHDDGFARFVLVDRGFTPRQAGRMLQRLFEIEAYRLMALLALPVARRLSPRLSAIEAALSNLTTRIAEDAGDDEPLMAQLTKLAAEVESELVSNHFRFGACKAYDALVTTRIAELRERRIAGLQTIDEFMARRFTPAVATCGAVAQRLHGLSERVAQASALLATRVGIARERQNQALLASMDRRAKLQLRLQQTVEGLSVAAIVYYAAGLVGYLSKGLKAGGLHVEPDLVVGASIPLLALLVMLAVRRARRHAVAGD